MKLQNNTAVCLILCAFVCVHGMNTHNYCDNSGSCSCTATLYDTEIQCRSNEAFVILRLEFVYDTVDIQCFGKFNWLDFTLPTLDVGDVEYLKFKQCPLPHTFTDITKKLGINSTKELRFDYSEDFVNVTSHYFKDFYKLKTLLLDRNNIERIEENTFALLTDLIQLDLNSNALELFGDEFNNLLQLEFLDLHNNNLTYIPPNSFKDLQQLQKLYLWANLLKDLHKDVFKTLKKMELLELSRNHLRMLPETLFYPLENLKQVSLLGNDLQVISKNIFRENKQIELINLSRNINLTLLADGLFSNLTKLETVYLNDCNMSNLSSNLFLNSIHLKNISLARNVLSDIPSNIFKDLTELQNVDLSYNKFIDLSDELFLELAHLKSLNLEGNRMTSLSAGLFKNLRNLEILNLKNNMINYIALDALHGMYNLKVILLSNNQFDLPTSTIPGVQLFNNNQRLTTIDLSHNQITAIDDNFVTFTNLKELDVSYNNIDYITFSDIFTVSFPIEINLKYNNISTINFDYAEAIARGQGNLDAYTSNSGNRIVYFEGNPIVCNCFMFSISKYFARSIDPMVPTLINVEVGNLSCTAPTDFIGYPVKLLKPNMLTCSLEELEIQQRNASNCSYAFRPWDTSLIINCAKLNLTKPPMLNLPSENFFNQTEVYLEDNKLTIGPKPGMGYENVTKLHLSKNNISELTWIPSQLEMLQLDNNNINSINYEILAKLNVSDVTHITLGGNPWICDCSNEKLLSFVTSASRKKKIDTDDIRCDNKKNLLVDLTPQELCPTHATLILTLGITICFIALLVAVLAALYYRFQQEVKVWLFAHNMFLWFVTEEELDKDKVYDAFISYSHKDENFVLNDLLPVLEKGPHPYKLCLHIRDWVAGEFITKQITTSVMESRRTIVILSRNFLESEWGKLEFRTAHKQAISEQRARVILILYGDINVDADLDDELKAYVRTNTYVKWGETWFWDKLRYALPHFHKKTKNSHNKAQNIMVAISEKVDKLDDKLDLINGPTSPNPSSTPPADPLLLKSKQMNFLPNQTLTPPAESGFNPLVVKIEN